MALPVFRKPRFRLIGDSNPGRTHGTNVPVNGSFGGVLALNMMANAIMPWACAYSDGYIKLKQVVDPGATLGYRCHSGDNGAYGNSSAQDVYDRLEQFYRDNPGDIYLAQYGAYDIDHGAAPASVDAIDALICGFLLSKGAIVIFTSLPGRLPPTAIVPVPDADPDNAWPSGNIRYTNSIGLNNLRKARATAYPDQIFYLDMAGIVMHPTTYEYYPGNCEDYAHSSAVANQPWGRAFWQLVQPMIVPRTASEEYFYSAAAYNQAGGWAFNNAGGALVGAGVAGSVAQGWELQRAFGTSHTCAASLAGGTQKLTISPSGVENYNLFRLMQEVPRPNWPDGTPISFRIRVKWNAFGGVRGITPHLSQLKAGSVQGFPGQGLANPDPNNLYWGSAGSDGWLTIETPEQPLQASTVSILLILNIMASNKWNPSGQLIVEAREPKFAPC